MQLNIMKVMAYIKHTGKVNAIQQAISSHSYMSNRVPSLRLPESNIGAIKILANRFGDINSYELEMLVLKHLETMDEKDLEEFKKRIMLSKLANPEITISSSERIAAAHDYYATEVENYEATRRKVESLKAQLDELNNTAEAVDVLVEWERVVDGFKAYMDEHGWFRDVFVGQDKEFFELVAASTKHIRFEADEDTGREKVVGEWDRVRNKLHREHICTIARAWDKVLVEKGMTSVVVGN